MNTVVESLYTVQSPLNPPFKKGGGDGNTPFEKGGRDGNPLPERGTAEEFEGWLRESGRAEKTMQAYLSDLRRFVAWFSAYYGGEEFEPGKMTAYDVQTWREISLGSERVSPATWNRRKASLSEFCEYLREYGLISHDPMRGVQSAEAVVLPPRGLDHQEYGRLMRWLEHAESTANTERRKELARRDAAMIGLMLFAGLREGEVVALTMADVEISERKGKVNVRRGKGDKYREVPLSAEARRLVAPLLSPLNPPIACDGGRIKIFAISTRAVQKRVAEIGRECRIENLTPHRFRHTAVKRMLDAGMDPMAVQQIAGHAKFATTAGYARPGWQDLERAVEGVAVAPLSKSPLNPPFKKGGRNEIGRAYA